MFRKSAEISAARAPSASSWVDLALLSKHLRVGDLLGDGCGVLVLALHDVDDLAPSVRKLLGTILCRLGIWFIFALVPLLPLLSLL